MVLAVLLAAGLVHVPPAAADRLAGDGASLPWARWGASAVWNGTFVYVAGGVGDSDDAPGDAADGATDEILRYDTVEREVFYAKGRLPTPRSHMAAVTDGAYVWFFGGRGCADAACDELVPLDEVVRYDTRTGAVTVVATLPSPRYGVAVAWDGRTAYLYGGRGALDTSEVVRFDARTAAVVRLAETLPSPRAFATALWVGDHALLFGGETASACKASACPGRDIVVHQPDRHAVTKLDVSLPSAVGRAALARLGDSALLFAPSASPPILRFDVVERRFRSVDGGPIPTIGEEVAVASDGKAVFLLGGKGATEILRFTFAALGRPSAPRAVQAFPGESAGRVAVTWQRPLHADGVEGYRLYRAFGTAKPAFLVAVDGTAYVDVGLPPGKQAHYLVAAVNPAGEGARAEVTVEVPGVACPPRALRSVPGPGLGEVTLRWTVPLCDGGLPIEEYVILRGRTTGEPVAVDSTTRTAFTDKPPADGKSWRYWIAAANAAGEGKRAGPARGIPGALPQAPETVTAQRGERDVRVAWEEAASNLPLVSYRVQRAVGSHAFETVVEHPGTVREHVDAGCPLNRECRWRVVAVNAAGAGPSSPEARAGGTTFVPALERRDDGTVLVYNDADRDGRADPGESLAERSLPTARSPDLSSLFASA